MSMTNTTQPSVAPRPMNAAPPPTNVFDQSAGNLNAATAAAQGAATYQPMQVGAPTYAPSTYGAATYNPTTYQAQTVGGANLNPYMNPYQQNVIDTTMMQLGEQQTMAQNNLDAQASSAGAFGGSRHGVAMGETAGQYADAQAQTLANLNSQNFYNAQNMAAQDAATMNNAGQFNATAGNQAGQFNAGSLNTAGQFNATSGNQAGQFNASQNLQAQLANQQAGLAGAGLNLNAAGSLGGLSQQGYNMGMGITAQQGAQGQQIQDLNQQIINAGRDQFYGYAGWPYTATGVAQSGTASAPYGQSSTTTQTQTPGLFDFLTLGLMV